MTNWPMFSMHLFAWGIVSEHTDLKNALGSAARYIISCPLDPAYTHHGCVSVSFKPLFLKPFLRYLCAPWRSIFSQKTDTLDTFRIDCASPSDAFLCLHLQETTLWQSHFLCQNCNNSSPLFFFHTLTKGFFSYDFK